MSYLGNTPTTQAFTPQVDYFSGDASTTVFTLSRSVASVAQVEAVIENVAQNPSSAYTVSGNTITFTSAPPSGTNNIYVRYTSPVTQVIQPGQQTVGPTQLSATGTPSSSTYLRGDNTWSALAITPAAVSDQANTSTGYFDLPAGTTAERPASPSAGATRFNTSFGQTETYNGTSWVLSSTAPTYSAQYLIVAGGGGGGQEYSGGGGAGGYIASSGTLSVSFNYPIVIGAGGAAGTSGAIGANGSSSSFNSSVAVGGGGGGGDTPGPDQGANGGSGGGGSIDGGGGSGTSGQGNSGSGGNRGSNLSGGGGGGAGAAGGGGNAGVSNGGNGSTWLNGSTYAGGGGGATASFYGGTRGIGGTGGGGNGSDSGNRETAGTANTGGGGGANSNYPTPLGSGGSGIVIIRYAGSQIGSGGTVTSSGGYTYHTFTTSGTYTA